MPLIHSTIKERRYKIVDGVTGRRSHKIVEKGKTKSTAKKRQIYYATHLDAQLYSYYSNRVIGPKYEQLLKAHEGLSECVIAYRRIPTGHGPNKGNIHFAKEVFDFIKSQKSCAVIVLDISKFFDSLDHRKLKKMWCKVLGDEVKSLPDDHYNIYKSLINFSFVELRDVMEAYNITHVKELRRRDSASFCEDMDDFKEKFVETGVIKKNPFKNPQGEPMGIPQGTPISALLANIYLYDFDKTILNATKGGTDALYRRYSDDLVLVCSLEDAERLEKLVVSEIKKQCKLTIHPSKTKKFLFRESDKSDLLPVTEVLPDGTEIKNRALEYLGFEFDGLRVLLKSSSLSKYYRKMKRGVRIKAWRALEAKKKRARKPGTDARLYKNNLYSQYSHLGRNKRKGNYLTYAYRASEIMEEPAIRRQVSKSWKILNEQIERYEKKYRLPKTTRGIEK